VLPLSLRSRRHPVLLVATALLAAACERGPRQRPSAEQAVLERRSRGLKELIAVAERGPLVAFEQILVVVDQGLVRQMLSAATPFERIVGERYRVRITAVQVEFDDGFGLVRLEGRASLASQSEGDAFAELSVYGAIDIVELDPASGHLRGRIDVVGFDVRRVDVLGVRTPAERLVEELGRERIEAFAVLASAIEIPVRLDQSVELPRVSASRGIHIPAASIPVRFTVVDVKAFRKKLWIAIAASAHPPTREPVSPGGPAAPAAASGAGEPPASEGRLAGLRRERDALRARLDSLAKGDPLLAEVPVSGGEVGVALRSAFVQELMEEVTRHYLDDVTIDLTREIRVSEEGQVKKKTPLGTLTAGEWRVQLTVHRVRGKLRAKPPRVAFGAGNRVQLAVPVVLEGARGWATVRFQWDARSLASIVCRDFELTQDLSGSVVRREYPISGDFVLSADGEALEARPAFGEQRFRIQVDLSRESWADVQRALESQDKLHKCGLALRPEEVLPRLQELGRDGFEIRLPRSIFRTVRLPAGVRRSVAVEQRQVELAVAAGDLRLDPQALWYWAEVRTRVQPASAPSPR
jgi:hypothetical protein